MMLEWALGDIYLEKICKTQAPKSTSCLIKIIQLHCARSNIPTCGEWIHRILKLGQVIDARHSRFPVTGEDRDEIVGVLLAKDLLKFSLAKTPEET